MNADDEILRIARSIRDEAAKLEVVVMGEAQGVEIIDRISEMPVNRNPNHQTFIANFGAGAFWPIRGQELKWRGKVITMPDAITGLTIHHTLSHSPLATAQYCSGPKGYPTTQYHYWISQGDGCPIYQLLPEEWAVWHDCTGALQTTLAIGMAGQLHLSPPPDEQIEQLVRLCVWLMDRHSLGIEDVTGHRERYNYQTQCPGWGPLDRSQRSWGSGWKEAFFDALRSAL